MAVKVRKDTPQRQMPAMSFVLETEDNISSLTTNLCKVLRINRGWISNPTAKSETARLHSSMLPGVCKELVFQMATKTTLFVTIMKGLVETFSITSAMSKAEILSSLVLSVELGFEVVFMSIIFFSSHF